MLSEKFFLLIIFLLPFSFAINPTNQFDLAIFRIVIPLFFLWWIFESLINKKLLIDTRWRFFYLIFFCLIIIFSFFWAQDEAKAVRKIAFILSFLPFYFISFQMFQEKIFLNKFLKIFFWSNLILTFLAIFQFFSQFIFGIDAMLSITKFINPFFLGKNFAQIVEQYPSWLVGIQGKTLLRAYGIFPDPHLFSLYINMSLPIIFYFYLKTKKNIHLIGSILMLLASLFSFARSGILALVISSFVLFLFYLFNKKSFKQRFVIGLIALSVAVFLFSIPNPVSNRLVSSFNLKEGSIQGRLEMWKISYQILEERPWGGIGIGNFSHYLESSSSLKNPSYAHNLFLDFTAETGIVNGILLVLLVFSPVWTAIRKPTLLGKALAFSFLILIIQGMFETPFFSVRVFPLILILLSIDAEKNN